MLGLICCRLWPFNDNVIQNDFQLSYIMPIRPGYDERERDATLFHQQMTFASFFSPYPSGSDQPSPGPKALCSWRYQYFAITRICPPFHHIPPTRLAIWPEIPRPFPTGESRHGWNWGYHTPLWGEPSIDAGAQNINNTFKYLAIIQRLSATAFFPAIRFVRVPGRLR